MQQHGVFWWMERARAVIGVVVLASAVVLGGALFGVIGWAGAAPSAGCSAVAGAPVRYQPPVGSEIIDGFRMNNGRYGAGNRGIEYQPGRSAPVGAVADGVVVFAGPVAGQLHVTVCHADGRRSSYSYLESVAVRSGDLVSIGTTVGRASERVHVGLREGRDYVDPEQFFARGELRVGLIPDASFGRSAPLDSVPVTTQEPVLDAAGIRVALRSTVGLGRSPR